MTPGEEEEEEEALATHTCATTPRDTSEPRPPPLAPPPSPPHWTAPPACQTSAKTGSIMLFGAVSRENSGQRGTLEARIAFVQENRLQNKVIFV